MKTHDRLGRYRIGVWSFSLLLTATPMAASGQAAQAAPPAGPPVRSSWTSDRVDLQVGDIITILIDELTQASADQNETASRERDRDLGVSLGTGGNASGGSLRTNNDTGSRTKGESTRRNRFVAEMSTRVVEVGAGGLLRLEGIRKVQIDKHEQEVTVRGWIRSRT